MNALDNIFGNIKGDVTVKVTLDPGSLILLAVLIVLSIVLSLGVLKAIG